MAFEFRLPDIGEGVVEGEVVRWLVEEGQTVREDQPMVEVMTDKATVEIPSPRAGRVRRILTPAGTICPVGGVMVVIDDEGQPEPRHHDRPAAPVAAPAVEQTGQAVPTPPTRGKVLATPATRQLARQLGVEIQTLRGTGPGGRITREDVQAAARSATLAASARRPEAQATDERMPFRGVRRKIADNMIRSKHNAAHFTYVEECDATELVALRARARQRAEERGIKLSYLPFIIKAVISGLKKYPVLNATLDTEREEIVLRRQYHIGIATATEAGLVVPVVRDADQLNLLQLAAQIEQLSDKARAGRASREELTGSTFTITSLGTLGGVLATPIINFPEVAILGVHKMKEAPVVRGGQIVIRTMMNLSLSLDHRIVDGYQGAQFLAHVISMLEDPTLLFMEMV
ncbi:MAG: dihydrolipoamide acetyltransferase family protein [Myxococcales bacterium]|nr:2-oxo acid dehydrogenase subunit E2 [Myxococcota bacterium]MDW8281778.1 dihydrolipoamide acetyltransferase family protein [Myxococcales bacterium]